MALNIGINKAKSLFEQVIKSGATKTPVFLHSSPGVGKSSIVHQLAKDYKLPVVDLRLAAMEATDLCGIPYVWEGEQLFSIPTWFPKDENSKGIIFLDELSNASTAVQHAGYRLILDREIQSGVKLPDGWFIVAAGNHKTDRTGVKGIVPALANRFALHLNITHNLEDFTKYAVEHGVDSRIIGFLNFKADQLYKFDPAKNDEQAFPTPRSWEKASELLSFGYEENDILTVVGGCVGEATAVEFLSFVKYYAKLPDWNKIMAGKEEYKMPREDLGLMFAVASSMIELMMQNHEHADRIKNLVPILDQLQDDGLVMIYKTISNTRDHIAILNIIEHTSKIFDRIEKHLPKNK